MADQRAGYRIVRDAPLVRPRGPEPDVCEHGRPDHQVMIRQLAEAMGLDLPAIAATPAQVWEALLGEVERSVRRTEDFHGYASGPQPDIFDATYETAGPLRRPSVAERAGDAMTGEGGTHAREEAEAIEQTAEWLAAIGYGVDFTSDVPLPEVLRWPLAHATWRIDNINGDPTPQSYYSMLAEECRW